MTARTTSTDASDVTAGVSSTPAVMAIPGISAELQQRLADGMAQVDATLRRPSSEDAFIMEPGPRAQRRRQAGPPAATLLAAQLGEASTSRSSRPQPRSSHHLASYHDDVSGRRRCAAAASVNAKYDNNTAILVGTCSSVRPRGSLPTSVPGGRIRRRPSCGCAPGRSATTAPPGDTDPVEYYLQILADDWRAHRDRCALRAMFALRRADRRLLREYGERVGMTFQLADDLVDVASGPTTWARCLTTCARASAPSGPLCLASTDPADARLKRCSAPTWPPTRHARHCPVAGAPRCRPPGLHCRGRRIGEQALALLLTKRGQDRADHPGLIVSRVG